MHVPNLNAKFKNKFDLLNSNKEDEVSMTVKKINYETLLQFFVQSWSIQSSSKWSGDNPAKGQCGVTALVINDIFGGEILKTMLPDGWHFYNRIDGKRYDLTKSQFCEGINYQDILSNREEAFSDTNQNQYNYLKQSVERLLPVREKSKLSKFCNVKLFYK